MYKDRDNIVKKRGRYKMSKIKPTKRIIEPDEHAGNDKEEDSEENYDEDDDEDYYEDYDEDYIRY